MSEYLNEPHEFIENCDCRDCAIKQRDMAIWMLHICLHGGFCLALALKLLHSLSVGNPLTNLTY